MKKIIAILVPCVLALALGIGAIFYFVGKKADGEITISEDAMPQLVHVLGEELDLSNGVLSYRIGKTSGKLPLSAEGITVSGYNKNKLGKQILTVSYEGFICRYTTNGKIVDLNKIAANRNGHYRVFIATSQNTLDVKIEITKA